MADDKSPRDIGESHETPTAALPAEYDEKAGELNTSHEKIHIEVFNHAKSATHKEQTMSLLQGIKLYPKAVAWSMLISTCICMEGYDLCLLSNFYGKYCGEDVIAFIYLPVVVDRGGTLSYKS